MVFLYGNSYNKWKILTFFLEEFERCQIVHWYKECHVINLYFFPINSPLNQLRRTENASWLSSDKNDMKKCSLLTAIFGAKNRYPLLLKVFQFFYVINLYCVRNQNFSKISDLEILLKRAVSVDF